MPQPGRAYERPDEIPAITCISPPMGDLCERTFKAANRRATEGLLLSETMLQGVRPFMGFTQAMADVGHGTVNLRALLKYSEGVNQEALRKLVAHHYTRLRESPEARDTYLQDTQIEIRRLCEQGRLDEGLIKLTAVLVAFVAQVPKGKFRVRLSEPMLEHIYQSLDAEKFPQGIGGATGFLALALSGLGASPVVMQTSPLPDTARHVMEAVPWSSRLSFFDGSELRTLQNVPVKSSGAHFVVDILPTSEPGLNEFLRGLGERFGIPVVERLESEKLYILLTGTSQAVGFSGVNEPEKIIQQLAQSSYMQLAALHYLEDPVQAVQEQHLLKKIANSGKAIGLLYSDPKDELSFATFLAENFANPAISFFGLNDEEVPRFLNFLHRNAAHMPSIQRNIGQLEALMTHWSTVGPEFQPTVLENASSILSRLLNIPLIRIRALENDCFFLAPAVDIGEQLHATPQAFLDALLASRAAAATKAYNHSGLPCKMQGDDISAGEREFMLRSAGIERLARMAPKNISDHLWEEWEASHFDDVLRDIRGQHGFFVEKALMESVLRKQEELVKKAHIFGDKVSGYWVLAPTPNFEIRGSAVSAGDMMDGLFLAFLFRLGVLDKANAVLETRAQAKPAPLNEKTLTLKAA